MNTDSNSVCGGHACSFSLHTMGHSCEAELSLQYSPLTSLPLSVQVSSFLQPDFGPLYMGVPSHLTSVIGLHVIGQFPSHNAPASAVDFGTHISFSQQPSTFCSPLQNLCVVSQVNVHCCSLQYSPFLSLDLSSQFGA
jgi:hypothetical protein